MLEILRVESTDDNPEIFFDTKNNLFQISGISMPEDATIFYAPILSWLSEYCKNPNKETVLEFDMEYFNSSSARKIFEIIVELEAIKEPNKAKILWKFDKIDEIMEERGEEISSVVDVPFEFIAY